MLKLNTLSGFGSGVSAGGVAAVKGYFQGGQKDSNTDKCEKLTFATSVMVANSDGDLNDTPEKPCEASDSVTYGYTIGGAGVADSTLSFRMTYATDVGALDATSDFPVNIMSAGTMNDGSTYSYTAGGYSDARITASYRLTHAAGTWATHTDADIAVAKNNMLGCCLSDGATYGYAVGGHTGAVVDTGERLTYSSGTMAVHTDADFATGSARNLTAAHNGPLAGYQTCGGSPLVDTTDKITFATGVSSTSTDMDAVDGNRNNPDGIGDNATYGYMTGGWQVPYTTETERMTYATEAYALHTDADLQVDGKGSGSTFSLGGV